MINKQTEALRSSTPAFRWSKAGGLQQRLLRSHLTIAFIGMVLLTMALITTLVIRSSAVRLARLRGPTARTSLLALSGTNRSLAGLRGWIVLGEPRFLDDLTSAWTDDIRPALLKLEDLSSDWTNPQNNQRLRELARILDELEAFQRDVARIAQTPGNEPARLLLDKQIRPIADAIVLDVTAMIDAEKKVPSSEPRRQLLGSMADFRAAFILCQVRLVNVIDRGSTDDEELFHDQLDRTREGIAAIVQHQSLLGKNQRQRLLRTQKDLKRYETLSDQALVIRRSDEWNVARYILAADCVPRARRATELLTAMSTNQAALMREDADRVTLISNVAIVCSIGLVLAMGIIARFVATQSARRITRPIAALAAATRELAAGELIDDIPIPDEGELGQLTRAFNAMRSSLEDSEQRFARAVEDAPFPIMIHAENGVIHKTNRAWTKLSGYDAGELPTITAWTERAFGQEMAAVKLRIDNLYSLDHQVHEGEYEPLTKSGAKRVWDFSSTPLGKTPDGQRLVLSSAIDVTERRQAESRLKQAHDELERRVEERTAQLSRSNEDLKQEIDERNRAEGALRESQEQYRILLENHLDGVTVTLDGKVVYANQPLFDLLGRSAEELIGRSPAEWVVGEEHDRALEEISDFMRGKKDKDWSEYTLVRKNGCPVPVDISSRLIQYKDKPALLSIIRDISLRRQLEEETRQHRERLAHVARLNTMGEMGTGLAHELNQPLAAIAVYASVCATKLRSDCSTLQNQELADLVEKIEEQSLRAGEIIHRLRKLVAKRDPEQSRFNINKAVRIVASLLTSEATLNEVTMQLDLDENIPEMLGDSIQIEQVCLNLLQNAIDAMSHGSPNQRQVTVRTALSGPHELEVTVSDTGPGIAPGDVDHIFNAFVTTKKDGMGMGLSISRTIVEAHAGKISVTPNHDRGVTFRLTLPIPHGNGQ